MGVGPLFTITADRSEDPIEVARGIGVVRHATVSVFEDAIGNVVIDVVYKPELGRIVADRVAVTALPPSEVTGTVMRSLRIQEYVQVAGNAMMFRRNLDGSWEEDSSFFLPGTPPSDPDERALLAADLHTAAKLVSLPPLREISTAMGVSQSTASRLVLRGHELRADHGKR